MIMVFWRTKSYTTNKFSNIITIDNYLYSIIFLNLIINPKNHFNSKIHIDNDISCNLLNFQVLLLFNIYEYYENYKAYFLKEI